jgi:hypothetical protein
LKKDKTKNFRLGKWEALKGHNYLSVTKGSITDVSLPYSIDKPTESAQLIVMCNCLYNEVVFNEMFSFAFFVSLFSSQEILRVVRQMRNYSYKLEDLSCFTFNSNGELNSISKPSEVPVSEDSLATLIAQGHLFG